MLKYYVAVRAIERNLSLYPLYLATTTEGITNAVWFLYLFSFKGLNLSQMAWLTLLGDGIIVLAEIPTGWLADRLTRRFSILCGIVLQALSALLFLWGHEFWQFWLAMAVCGLGDTFRSGADQALLYDSCIATGNVVRFRQLLAQSMFIMTLALMGCQVLGGFTATYVSWELGFWLEVLFSAAGFLIVFIMREPPRLASAPGDCATASSSSIVRRSRWSRLTWLLLPLPVLAAITGVAPELSHFYLPAELNTDFSMTPLHLGLIYAAFEFMQGWGNKLAAHQRYTQPARILPWLGVGMISALALFGLRGVIQAYSLWVALVVYLAARAAIDMLYGLSEPLISEEVNRRSPSAVRATVLSVVNAARRGLPLLLLPLAVSISATKGVVSLYLYIVPVLLLSVIVAGLWTRYSSPRAA